MLYFYANGELNALLQCRIFINIKMNNNSKFEGLFLILKVPRNS
jgi:hypothetical protein